MYSKLNIWFSSIIAIIILGCSSGQSQQTNGSVFLKLEPAAFKAKMDSVKDFQLLDVRTAEEYKEQRLANSFFNDIYETDFAAKNDKLDKNKPVFVYCKGGGRSAKAAEQLKQAGFKYVYDLAGGIMAWSNANLPTEKANTEVKADVFNETDFNTLTAGKLPVLVDFYAKWCIPCKKMEPILDKLSKEFDGKIIIKRINVDESPALSKKMNVTALPIVTSYKNAKEIKRNSGFQSEEELRKLIAELMK